MDSSPVRLLTIDDVDLKGKTVILRVDYNVPMADGVVQDSTRIDRSIPTLEALRKKGAKIVILSHMGQPGGKVDARLSLYPVTKVLSDALWGDPITFVPDCHVTPEVMAMVKAMKPGDIVVMENTRFRPEEVANDAAYAQELAKLGDFYVNDAFSVSHRAHASIDAITRFLPSLSGGLMREELSALHKVLEAPKRPLMALVGGAKISSKLGLLEALIAKVNCLAIGGAMANTLLMAKGYKMGNSMTEPGKIDVATHIIEFARHHDCDLVLPSDAMVVTSLDPMEGLRRVMVDALNDEDKVVDIGPTTIKAICARIRHAKTLLWNGPLGMFEVPPFDEGTARVAQCAVAATTEHHLVSVAGGGDTVAALVASGCASGFSYISSGGGAFLEFIEGLPLPGVEALRTCEKNNPFYPLYSRD